MKAILEFNLSPGSEDADEFKLAIQASRMAAALGDILQELFRPARKHGYSDLNLADMVAQHPEYSSELINMLEERFHKILQDRGVDIELY